MKSSLPQSLALATRAKSLMASLRHRAKKLGGKLEFGAAEIRALLETAKVCVYCVRPLSFELTLDHQVPLDRGGAHSLDNLVVCCRRCNSLKGLMDGREFQLFREFLAKLHPKAQADVTRRLLGGGRVYDGRSAGT